MQFHCKDCGKCCYGNPQSHYITITNEEAEQIQHPLRLSRDWFLRRYTRVLLWGDRGIRLNANGACPFLANTQCLVYHLRPAQCRSYPFWPELVAARSGWQAEARRCEGIDRGAIVPLEEIE